MKTPPRGGRLALILLSTLTLTAGCARGTAAFPDSAPSPSTTASPTTTASHTTTASTSRTASTSTTASTGTTTSTGTGRSAVNAASGLRPAAGATPVFTVSTRPTLYCDTTYTRIATTVAYDDGTVLVANGLGAYCDPVPEVRVGMIDVAELDRLAAEFFDSPEATVDLSELPVTDLPYTTVSYQPAQGDVRSIDVYGLGTESGDFGGVPTEQLRARTELGDLIDAVGAPAAGGRRWVPDRLVVVGGIVGGPGYSDVGTRDPVRRWPVPLTPALRKAIGAGGNHRTCALIDDAVEVAAVLEAHGSRATGARWTVEGRQRGLAIGIKLPGFPDCSG